jgi:hypothetical protein
MWPFSEPSLKTATRISDIANLVLCAGRPVGSSTDPGGGCGGTGCGGHATNDGAGDDRD